MENPVQGQDAPSTSVNTHEENFPIAEMAVKAAVAIWVILFFTMFGFWVVRSGSLGGAVVLLILAFIFYGAGTAIFMLKPHYWITSTTTDPEEKRIYDATVSLSGAAGFPSPRVAIDGEDQSINAYTYGLNRNFAHVVVTRGLLDHVKPTDDELKAIIAHELGHVKHGDCVISTLLKFPIWVMDRIRWLMHLARSIGVGVLRIFGSLVTNWVGLLILLMILVGLFYLSISIFFISLIIGLCMLVLNAFEREREYLADQYSAELTGNGEHLQQALAKLEQAQLRAEEEIIRRIDSAEEGEEVDTYVAPPTVAFEGSGFVNEAMKETPTFWRSITSGEIFLTHPLTENRVYFLAKPRDRKRFWSNALIKMEELADSFIGHPEKEHPTSLSRTLLTGGAVGALMGIVPTITPDWLTISLSVIFIIGGGLALGYFAGTEGWSGRTFARRAILAAFIMSIALMITGPIFNNGFGFIFPMAFLVALLFFGGFGVAAARFVKGRNALTPFPIPEAAEPQANPDSDTNKV